MATVEIQVLTIDSKKATLAMFRQIPLASIVNPDTGERFGGEPWGVVNYHFPWCNKSFRFGVHHIHVLWQFDGRLWHAAMSDRGYNQDDRRTPTEQGDIERKYREEYRKLAALPQLFIAP